MPDESFNFEFSADVQDFASKSQQVTDSMNKIAQATEKVNDAGRSGSRTGGSPYARQINEAKRELAATQKMAGARYGDPYWSDVIRRQRAVVENLQKKDRAEEAKKYDQEQDLDKRRETFRERLTRYRAGLESTLFNRVNKDREKVEDTILSKQKVRHAREVAFVRGVAQAATRVQQGLSYVGLGGVGRLMGRGAVSGASAAIGAGMGITGATALGAAGMIGAAGLAAGGTMLWGVRRALSKNPALPYDMEIAGYVNPAEAMNKTRTLSKAVTSWEGFKTKLSMGIAEKIDSLMTAVTATAFQLSTRSIIKKTTGLDIDLKKPMYALTKHAIGESTPGELRYWMEQSRSALGPTGPSTDLGKMGLYATSSEAIRVNRQDITQTEMVNAMKDLTAKMSALAERGIFGDIGGAGKAFTRS